MEGMALKQEVGMDAEQPETQQTSSANLWAFAPVAPSAWNVNTSASCFLSFGFWISFIFIFGDQTQDPM
jgi:hypothetical protein